MLPTLSGVGSSNQTAEVMKKYYVLFIWGDVDPELIGPFKSEAERNAKAKQLKAKRGDDHGIFRMEEKDGEVTVGPYPVDFFI